MPESCAVCGGEFPFSNTVHMLVHTQSDEGVLDLHVCKPCYESEIAARFSNAEDETTATDAPT